MKNEIPNNSGSSITTPQTTYIPMVFVNVNLFLRDGRTHKCEDSGPVRFENLPLKYDKCLGGKSRLVGL